MTSPKIVALVPMRHSSERVRGKNYRTLIDRPLFHYIVTTLSSCKHIDEVAIDTDSPVIIESARRSFPDVHIIERPEHLVDGRIAMNEILMHDISQIKADYYIQTHSTNPFLRAATVDAAIAAFLESGGTHDSLFTVTPLHTRLWWPSGEPVNHDPAVLQRTQDMTPVYEENSCLYLFDGKTLAERKNRIGARPFVYPMEAAESIDIDTETDWAVAEALMAKADWSSAEKV